MSFEKTALLRHPLVEQAYRAVETAVGLRAREVKEAIAAAEIYSAKATSPKPEVAAALLFNNYAYPQVVDTLGTQVHALADFALEMAGLEKVVSANGNRDHADIILAQVAVQAAVLKKEISTSAFYIFKPMQDRLLKLKIMADLAAIDSANPALADAAATALAAAGLAQAKRIDNARQDSVFANSGLPAHALVKRVYNDMRAQKFQTNPHVAPLQFEMGVVKILRDKVDHLSPEVIAATLLNQCFVDTPEILRLYGSRVAELHAASAPVASADGLRSYDLEVDGAADIRGAIAAYVLENRLATLGKTPAASKEDALYDIEYAMTSARRINASGMVSPRLSVYLDTLASQAQNTVHTPENAAIRKPGSPRPLRGW